MSARERYIKVIESLVEGEDAKASELLHEAFVEKAREIWNDLVEADEIVEDELAEEELEESYDDADDFIDDINDEIEEDLDEIEAEERFEGILRTIPKYGKNDITLSRYLNYHKEIQELIIA